MQNKSIVLDSSVIAKFLFSEREKDLDHADRLMKDAQGGKIILVAPFLARYEMGNVIRFRDMTPTEKAVNWDNFCLLPIRYMDTTITDGRKALIIAETAGITFYDAVFMALAGRLNATLVTANPKHQKRFPGVTVVELKEY